MNDQPFSTEQQEYLKGFMAGVEAKHGPIAAGSAEPADPNDLQRAVQDRTIAAGGKLVPEEQAKRKNTRWTASAKSPPSPRKTNSPRALTSS